MTIKDLDGIGFSVIVCVCQSEEGMYEVSYKYGIADLPEDEELRMSAANLAVEALNRLAKVYEISIADGISIDKSLRLVEDDIKKKSERI